MYLSCQPASHKHADSAVPFGLLGRMELDDHLVQRTTHARLFLAVGRLVPFSQEEVPYERVVYDALQYNAHEAGLTHVVEST